MSQGRRSHREPRGGYGGAALGGAAAAAAAAACVAAEGEAEADSKAAGDPQRGASKSSESKGAATGGGAPAAGAEARYEWFLNAHGSAEWDGNWDLRAGSTAEAQKWGRRRAGGRGTNYIYLIRHGQYVHGDPRMDDKAARGPEPEEDFLLNDPLRVLTPLGRKQAAHTGEALAAILANDELKRESTTLRVYSSDMARAAETGRIVHGKLKGLARGFPRGEGGEDGGGEGGGGKDGGAANPARAAAEAPLIVDSLLREGAPVPPEGYRGPWKPQRWEFYEEGARIEAAFRKFVHRVPADQQHDSVTVIVCHGNVIRYFLTRALQLPPGGWLRFSLMNGSVTRLSVRGDGSVSVRNVGDTLGMAPADTTYQ